MTILRGQGFNRISPAKKDPKKKAATSIPTVASRLRAFTKPVPPMGGKK